MKYMLLINAPSADFTTGAWSRTGCGSVRK